MSTRSHPDHYFGFGAVKEVFPEARLVALPATVAGIEMTWEGEVKQWRPIHEEAITDKPIVPEALQGSAGARGREARAGGRRARR